ncbi:MAG: DNA polymerase III subunit delta [Deferrisomatales bacterium]
MSEAPVVYLYGDETFLIDRALGELEAETLGGGDPRLNREVFEAPEASAAQVVAAARTAAFLGARRLVVVKNADRWSAEAWKPLLPYLESPNPGTCLVFVAQGLDRRSKAGKLLAKTARVVECRRPREQELAGWARRLAREAGLELEPAVLAALVGRIEPDLQLLSREIEKLRAFAGADGTVRQADLEQLVGESRGTTVFALCDALGEADLGGALRALRKLLALGEPPPRLLFMIVRHFRHLWRARELLDGGGRTDPKTAAAALGVPPFVARRVLGQARRWEAPRLARAFSGFLQADLALKSGGGSEVLDRLVLGLCGREDAKRPGNGRGVAGRG